MRNEHGLVGSMCGLKSGGMIIVHTVRWWWLWCVWGGLGLTTVSVPLKLRCE